MDGEEEDADIFFVLQLEWIETVTGSVLRQFMARDEPLGGGGE